MSPARTTAVTYSIICSIALIALVVGIRGTPSVSRQPTRAEKTLGSAIPSIGSVEVLNGCGMPGAATAMTDFLRNKGFDVKSSGNAESWNYPRTLVVARTLDQSTAKKLCAALKIDRLVLIRTNTDIYDASVIIGKDYGDLINDDSH